MYQRIKTNKFFIITSIIIFSILLYLSYFNEISEGGPDGYWHYNYSKYALNYPDLFLHHWGKPLFILLSTTFSQFGIYGLKVFNVICGLLTSIFIYKTLLHLNVKFAWISSLFLLFTPLYFLILQSALTEPLFSLILSGCVYFYITNKNILASILVSFILFSRSEGMFIIPCFGLYLLIIKKWKLLPLLFTGFVVYAFVGLLMGHEFLWYFSENPYNLQSPYGHGHFMDILKRYDSIWGSLFLILLIISFITIIFLYFKEKQYVFWKEINETSKIVYLVVIPSLAFLIFHLLVWHFGMCGSAGLERVLACVLPLNVLLTIWALNKLIFIRFSKLISFTFISIILFFHLQAPFKALSYPLKSWGSDRCFLDATNWFKTIMPNGEFIVYYTYPNVTFNLNRDPFNKFLNRELTAFKKNCQDDTKLPIYLFWESAYSENSCGIRIEDVEKCNYKNIKEFTDGGDFKLIVFEKEK
jgi:hypothetical protein